MKMHVQVISIFPQMFAALCDYGVTGRALKKGLWCFSSINPRDFADNQLGYIDDRPFGGGPGMVMQAGPLLAAYREAQKQTVGPVRGIYLSPQGQILTQRKIQELAQASSLILVCGRYEGVDERFIELSGVEEISVGDFVVSGGELPAMLLIDSVLRLVPEVLGDSQSVVQESFVNGLLDYPQYTRPEHLEKQSVPSVLLSGNHQAIKKWRLKMALSRTLHRRPDLLEGRQYKPEESCLLQEIDQERQDVSI